MRRSQLALVFFFVSGVLFSACGDTSGSANDPVTRADIKAGSPANAFPDTCLVDLYDAQNHRVALCSGSLVAPSVILTAGHCVADYPHFHVICPFLHQEADGTGEAHPNYHTGPSHSLSSSSDDIGLVYLNSRISLAQYPLVSTTEVPDRTWVINVGRTLDGVPSDATLYQGAPVRVLDGKTYNFPHDYFTSDTIQGGDSGGPTYLATASVQEIIAVNSGAGDGFEVLARTDLTYSWINTRVNQHGGWTLPLGAQPLLPEPIPVKPVGSPN